MIPLELSPFLRLNPALPKRALQNGELSRMANIFIHAGSVIQAYGWDPLINTPVFTLRTWSNYAVGEKWNNTVNTWLNQGSVGGIIRHIQEHIDTAGNTYVCIHTNTQFLVYNPTDGTYINLTKGSAYTSADFWSADTYGDWYVFSNGVDNVQAWKLTKTLGVFDDAVDLGGVPPKARVVLTVGSYLMLLGIESGTDTDLRKVQWSQSGLPESWTGGDSGNLYVYEGEGNIVAAKRLTRDSVAVYKTGSFHRLVMAGFPYYFVQQGVVSNIGLLARRGVADIGGTHVVLSTNGLVSYDGSGVTPFQPMVNTLLDELYPANKSQYAIVLDERVKRRLWVMVPEVGSGLVFLTRAFVFDFNTGSWAPQDTLDCTTATVATVAASYTSWSAMTGTWAQATDTWFSRLADMSEMLVLGDSSGYLQRAKLNLSLRSNNSFTSVFETRMFNPGTELFQSPHTKCEFVELYLGTQADTVTVEIGTSELGDNNISWSTPHTPVNGYVYTTIVGRWFILRVTSTLGFDISNITPWFVKRGTL